MPGPLHGFKVVDLSAVMSGPLATTLLADQGAGVIKVEQPGVGDVLRYVGSSRGGMSATFHATNRGKRAIAIDLSQPRGLDILLRLVDDADVFVQNFRPGVTARMGLGFEALHERNPDLVYLSISGFGPTGPYAQKRVYDNVIQAYSGMNDAQASRDGTPEPIRQLVCDKLTAYTAAQAVTAALLARERGAGGQHIELSMLDSAIAFLWPDASSGVALLGDDASPQPSVGSHYTLMRLADGHATATPLTDSEFQGLCRAFELEEAATDPRFSTLAARMQNVEALGELFRGEMAEAAARTPVDDFQRAADAHDVPAGVVRRVASLHEDPQVRNNATLQESEHPAAGALREARPAPVFHRTPVRPGGPAPALGEHTDEILGELGLGHEVGALRAAGVVG